MRKLRIWVMSLILVVTLGVIGAGAWWYWATQPYSSENTSDILAITPGMTAVQVGEELERRHLIRSAFAFRLLAGQLRADSKLYAGEYLLSAGMSPREILNEILKGPETALIRVTIPEGYTTDEIVNLFVQKGIGTRAEFEKVLATDSFNYAFLKGIPQGPHRLDGFLFPDTYFFDKKTTPHAAVDMMLQRFQKEVTPNVEAQLKKMQFSIHDWVTLASIVEKEAAKETDRPLIAGVFMNRLKTNMPLQSCATVQYVLGTRKPVLSTKDIQVPSPYNTYLHTGLPPGPIASPGHASLDAVIHAAKTDYFYFLAKPDGYHVFAKTYSEQLQNQKKYQQ